MNATASKSRPALTLVHNTLDEAVPWSWFCGHCAAPSPGGEPPAPNARVCRSCGLGLLLETREDVAPEADDAFLVVDSSLRVHALSERAEELLGVREDLVVNRPLAELLVPADVEGAKHSQIAAAVADAVGSGDHPSYSFVRPWNTYGVRVRARVVACGPPRAALIVLEGPRRGQLHAVTSL
jgi:PAS domain-containing protein